MRSYTGGVGVVTLIAALLAGGGAFTGGWWVGAKVERAAAVSQALEQAREARKAASEAQAEKARIEREAIEREQALIGHYDSLIERMNRRVAEAMEQAIKDRESARIAKERQRRLERELEDTASGLSECRLDDGDVRMLNRASATANRGGLPDAD